MKSLLQNLALLSVSLLIGLGALEVISRIVLPVRAAPFVDAAGNEVDLAGEGYRLRPNVKVWQHTGEFDAEYTTTAAGHRLPGAAGGPDVIFIGDSFTFGYGVNDLATFVALFCAKNKVSCANLGRVGTGTAEQIDLLTSYLEREGWRPRRVHLMMFAMTGALMYGNDLTDNLAHANKIVDLDTDSLTAPSADNILSRCVARFRLPLQKLNLIRVVLLYTGPLLRSWFTPGADAALVAQALEVTGAELRRLDALAHTYGFAYDVTLIHPVQDIMRGTDQQTAYAIRSITPGSIAVRSTADALRADPAHYYYSLDMHLNAAGHRAIADFLTSVERGEAQHVQTAVRVENGRQ